MTSPCPLRYAERTRTQPANGWPDGNELPVCFHPTVIRSAGIRSPSVCSWWIECWTSATPWRTIGGLFFRQTRSVCWCERGIRGSHKMLHWYWGPLLGINAIWIDGPPENVTCSTNSTLLLQYINHILYLYANYGYRKIRSQTIVIFAVSKWFGT